MDPQTELPRPWKDDKLKKRLIGALVVMIGGFVLVSVLPRPDDIRHPPQTTVVTIPLREGDVVQTPPPPSAQATPPSVGLAPPDPQSAPEAVGAAPDEVEASAAGDDDAAGNAPSAVAAAPSAEHEPEPTAEAHKPAAAASDAPPAAAISKPAVAVKPVVSTASKPPAKPDVRPAAPVMAMTPAPAAPPPAKAGAATISSNGNWFVQTGGFAAIANARQAQQQVQAKGLNCILSPVDTDKGTIYRVRAGPFASREVAQAAQARLASAGIADSKLVAP